MKPAHVALLIGSMSLAACGVPVAGGLDDAEANRVFVALDRSSVEATKEADPAADGKWRISVSRDDLPRALTVMRDDDLPRREPADGLGSAGKGSIVPSEAAEHAQVVAGIAAELERTLDGVDGVLRARVHLNIPAPSPLRPAAFELDTPPPRGSASVLIEHEGAAPPLSVEAIQRLVAGGAPGLLPADVAVITVSRPAPPVVEGALDGATLARVGPIAARASVRRLQAALAALVGLVAALAAATLVLYARLARLTADRPDLLRDAPPGA